MEVFAVPTPTSSGNYKPNLESFLKNGSDTPEGFEGIARARGAGLERDADLLASSEIAIAEAVDFND